MATFADKAGFEITLLMAAFTLSILSAVFLVRFFFAMLRRAVVKRYLRQRGCTPINVRWLIIAWGIRQRPSVAVQAAAFRVIYAEANGLIHKAYCWVGYDVSVVVAPIFSRSPLQIEWVKDEIIGELPLAEVWVSDKVLTKKLKANSQQHDC
jgi:hypothetical protein